MVTVARAMPAGVVEESRVPPAPTTRNSLSAALSGFYYNSWRLVPANLVWGTLLMLTLALVFIAPGLAVVAFLLVLPLPTAGMFRLSAMIVRHEPVALSDALAWPSFAKRAVGTGLVVGGASLLLGFNVVIGLSSLDPLGWGFATAAFWGVVILWLVAAALWPLLFDPLRADEPVTAIVRLAATVVVVRPSRYVALIFTLAVFILVSTILVAALLSVSMAFVALVLAAYVIPAADRIEGRRTFVITS
jgi:hypothetical protein